MNLKSTRNELKLNYNLTNNELRSIRNKLKFN